MCFLDYILYTIAVPILNNIMPISWSAHIEQFLTDTEITRNCDMCVTEAYTYENNYTEINEYLNRWKVIHLCTEHGLQFCFKEESVKVIKKFVYQQQ